MRPPRAILELLASGLDREAIAHIQGSMDRKDPALKAILRNAKVSEQLRHDLWDIAHGVEVEERPLSDVAALEIFRQVRREYQAFSELGPKERRGAIQDFILSVESQVRDAITCSWEEFTETLQGGKMGRQEDAILCGRYFAAAGTWPVRTETFELRGKVALR